MAALAFPVGFFRRKVVSGRPVDEKQARLLKLAGATVVVPETLEASLPLSAFVLESLGLEELELDGIVDEERALFNEALSHVQKSPAAD